ncbi:MAG TPA: hypothetical protein VFW33_09295 [Gemmataceae bacterium]|nr:hypothetical protein [Gemmataceae bacterium]
MRRRMTWAWAVLTALAAPAAGQSPDPKPDELFASARAHLEAALGGRLTRLPKFVTVAPADLAALPDALIDARAEGQLADLDAGVRARARAAATAALRGATVAALREGEDTILVAPENAVRIVAWDPALAGAQSAAFLRLALVHETARWVLDRQYDLPRRRAACRDSEDLIALQAVVEGRCQWVTRQVAQKLGDESAFALLAEAYRYAPDTKGEGAVRVLCHDVLARRRWCCTQGLAFFDALDHAGVKDAEARAFAHPPRQTAWLERPALYLRAERLALGDLGESLKRLEGALAPEQWQAAQQPWTPEMFRDAAAVLGQAQRAEVVLRGWDAGRSLVWSARANPGRQVALGLLRFQDAAAARAYYGLAVDLQREQDELLNAACANHAAVVDSHAEALRLAGADEAVRADKKVRLGNQGDAVAITQLWARAGERVVELSWHGVSADTAWAQRLLDELLRDK